MFRLTREELAEIAAAEFVGWKLGVPLVGTATALTVRMINQLIENTAEVRLQDLPNAASDEFLNQHPLPLQGLYDREKLLRDRLLYVESANFIDRLVKGREVNIEIAPLPGLFQLTPFADPATEVLREQGFERLREVGKYTHDSDIIRTSQVEETPTGARLTIQRARYSDQARSNLILDFDGRGSARTIRETLGAESPGLLPALDDPRLVNSLGVTILVFYKDDQGNFVPFLVPRTRKVAVMNRGLWSDSASGAAEWPPDPENTPSTFENYILDDLYKEMESEIGLFPKDMITILPLAIGREIMRAGKPQMFFIGFTSLGRSALIARMEEARRKNKKNPIEPDEIFKMPILRKAPTPGDPSRIHSEYEAMMVDPQCAASLYYSLAFLERLGAGTENFPNKA